VTVLDWLLASAEPIVRYRARTWLLAGSGRGASASADRAGAPDGDAVRTLLAFPDRSVNPYRKWWGLHWRLVSLADLDLPADRDDVRIRLDDAINHELDWIADPRHLAAVRQIDGLYRADASMEGNAVYAATRFGHAGDPRVRRLVDSLLVWQWPDGGWNCDRRSSGYRSSFHESWHAAIGLAAYHEATGDSHALAAARRTAELLLQHQLYRSLDGRRTIHSSFAVPHWPAYWHYDLLAGLRVLRAVDRHLLRDPRAALAMDRLESLLGPDGRLEATRPWWRAGGPPGSSTDAVDWGGGLASEVLTLQALAILRFAGRWNPDAAAEAGARPAHR
jgi:hypothetical protein